jgi:DNA-binding beta-propeller fold protein YncE
MQNELYALDLQPTLTYSHTIGFLANQGRGFNNPVDLCLDNNGLLYVLNRAGPEVGIRLPYKRVTICSKGGDYITEFGTGGTSPGEFWWPSSIAMSPEGTIFVSDEALNRITMFTIEGEVLGCWGEHGSRLGMLNRPSYIEFDKYGALCVSDSMNHRIQRFSPDGSFINSWGDSGAILSHMNMPWGIYSGQAGIYVCDWRNNRITLWDSEGNHVGNQPLTNFNLNRPAHLTITQNGELVIADWGNDRVVVVSDSGDMLQVLQGESGASNWALEYLEANPDERDKRNIANLHPQLSDHQLDRGEPSANTESFFWGPTSVQKDKQGAIYIVDSCRHRIQIYNQDLSNESLL